MTTLSTLLLYAGVFVVGGLGVAIALGLMSPQTESSALEDAPSRRPSSDDAVDPIRSLGF